MTEEPVVSVWKPTEFVGLVGQVSSTMPRILPVPRGMSVAEASRLVAYWLRCGALDGEHGVLLLPEELWK